MTYLSSTLSGCPRGFSNITVLGLVRVEWLEDASHLYVCVMHTLKLCMLCSTGCLNDLEPFPSQVEAIQSCGGQKTADGGRYRTGGGILWNILKVRDPNAYKEIMRKGKEFEKQFKPHNLQQEPQGIKVDSCIPINSTLTDQRTVSDGLQQASNAQNDLEQSEGEQKRASVRDRLRIPVSYDDLLEGENPKDQES
ncbi:hypothetical protein M9H77_33989 [Catharanthus roseus]|uniref:Uncharacterized protein n=1 Tax=Catharanthus roseus TaxID=4058 RepID=A0ACB9ZLM2_CATRO|nr:hypothetical protein M9H77_33989 [Catharanthus roseus]